MKLALAIASAVVLLVHGIVFYDQFFHKWESYQTAWFDQARTQARNQAEKEDLAGRSPKIEQIIVTQFGENRVDRCTTCHIAIDDPRFKDHFEPLKTHPLSAAMGDVQKDGRWERRHKFNDFGCTVCHDGQGRGLDTEYSHGVDEHWNDPLSGFVTQANWRRDYVPHLKGKEYMEANCAQCHTDENFPGTPHVARGRQLFISNNCYGCHKIEGISDGTLAPELTEAGHKFRIDYLWESIADPRANLATSFMPKFNLSNEDIKSLVIFLKSRRGVNYAETSLSRYRAKMNSGQTAGVAVTPIATNVAASPALTAQGKQLFEERACGACHKMGEKDGGISPDLSFEGLLRPSDWLMAHFKTPRSRISDSNMPAFRFTPADFEALTAYLVSLKTPPSLPAEQAKVYTALCARCHGDKGDGLGITAFYLDPAPRDLTKASFFNSKSDERFLQSILEGVPGTSMPPWKNVLSEDQAKNLFAYVRQAYVKEKPRTLKAHSSVPANNPVATGADSIRRGEEAFLKRCTGCHGLKADGKGPNSLDIVPHPRNLRNRWFLDGMSDNRAIDSILYGIQGTAMPPWIDYGLSVRDAGDLVNYIRSLTAPPAAGKVAVAKPSTSGAKEF